MQVESNLIPVESDVNLFLSKERDLLDNDIADLFKHFNLAKLLRDSSIKKRCGHSVTRIVYDLMLVPFLYLPTIYLFVHTQYEKAASAKNKYYRLLENANFNWKLFLLKLSKKMHQEINSNHEEAELFYVLDDTICEVSGKLVEAASYHYDHVSGKSVLGFQKLVLGLFNGSQFIPISQRICKSKKIAKSKSKATKYNKVAKEDNLKAGSPGAIQRDQLTLSKLDKAIEQLSESKKQGLLAKTVLFDSWFCFNSFIIKIVENLNLDIICQLKNLPRANKYIYNKKSYSLKELYGIFAKSKLRYMTKNQFKQSQLTVSIANSSVKLKIVFIKNDSSDKWHAFAASNSNLTAKKILEDYSQRWSIEVFFKNCKQYLNYGKEQMSNLDSVIACDALVFMRYIFLTYLAFKENATFYEKFTSQYKSHNTKAFGIGLLKFFFYKIQFLVNQIIEQLESGLIEEAKTLLKSLKQSPQYFNELSLE